MKTLYIFINKSHASKSMKNASFLLLNMILFSAMGYATWFVLHFIALNTISWALCFTGYPGYMFGLFGGIIYLYRREFS